MTFIQWLYRQTIYLGASWHGALMFYTCLPIDKIWPERWPLEFRWIACWAPWVGCVVGGLLAVIDQGLASLHLPVLVRSTIVVGLWIVITGGLHLDGVMDTADGLAVPAGSQSGRQGGTEQGLSKRLTVMSDSRMGAFGGMAAISLLLLKFSALAGITRHRPFVLVAAAMWGRWGQQWAIARYPYLKKEGKGAFHKAALPSIWHTVPSLLGMGGLAAGGVWLHLVPRALVVKAMLGGLVMALLTSWYFYRKLGGHTGDTYGAVVEWTEALLLCVLATGP